MNHGTFAGAGSGASGGAITGYTESHIIKTSQMITAPAGTKRIEALMCGGGGSSSTNNGGGGFGGLAVMGIPVTGMPYSVVVGAGGTGGNPGNPSQVWSAGMMYAEVGGGGGSGWNDYNSATHTWKDGRSGGCGAGMSTQRFGGNGGSPPIGDLLWYFLPSQANFSWANRNNNYPEYVYAATSNAGFGAYHNGNYGPYTLAATRGSLGGGSGGGVQNVAPAPGGGGGGGSNYYGISTPTYGGGSGCTETGAATTGGSLAPVTIWGITGKQGGNPGGNGGGGGGGLLGAGGNGFVTVNYSQQIGYNVNWEPLYRTDYYGGPGGDGGGGAGANYFPGGDWQNYYTYYDMQGNYNQIQYVFSTNGVGGNGFVIFRFFF